MLYDDTITAIATPPGEGGIGIIRLSGPEALTIISRIFEPAKPGPLQSFRLRYGTIKHPDSQQPIDEVLVALMRGPRSFTREDVVEISCHGGPIPIQSILSLTIAEGARLAEPGEFTMRAFLNGRIDLTQAEATLDVIQARTETALALAQAQLGGWLAQEVQRIRSALLEPLAYFTVLVDFPEDEVEAQDPLPILQNAYDSLQKLLANADQGMIYRQGARVALVGLPNVGKSSLLNRLLRTNRAIVTPIAGTTRDTLEETANLAGIPVVLVDTAGITETEDVVEQIGVERSRSALADSDLALLVLDSSLGIRPEDQAMIELTSSKPTILVWNKSDLASALPSEPYSLPAHIQAQVAISALTGEGIENLAQAVAKILLGGAVSTPFDPAKTSRVVSNVRHRDALIRAAQHLTHVLTGYQQHDPTDLLTVDMTAALNALGEVTGETVGDDLLATIFSKFCIGK
jgi:tRNA modification GTPase